MEPMNWGGLASKLGHIATLLLAAVGGIQLARGSDQGVALGILGYLIVSTVLGLAAIAMRRGQIRLAFAAMVSALLIDLSVPALAKTPLPPLVIVLIRDPIFLTIVAGGLAAFWFVHRPSPDGT